jgi:hypothetical protein
MVKKLTPKEVNVKTAYTNNILKIYTVKTTRCTRLNKSTIVVGNFK